MTYQEKKERAREKAIQWQLDFEHNNYSYSDLAAFEHHFDYFTTVMTVSCKKPSRELNEIAEKLSLQYPTTKYLYSDFKKDNGQLKGILISKEYNLYRQDYCGCLPSLEERKRQKEAQSAKSR